MSCALKGTGKHPRLKKSIIVLNKLCFIEYLFIYIILKKVCLTVGGHGS